MKHLLKFLALLLLLKPSVAAAQEEQKGPLSIQAMIDQSAVERGDSFQAVMVLCNNSNQEVLDINLEPQSLVMDVEPILIEVGVLPPAVCKQYIFLFESQLQVDQQILFSVFYRWQNPETSTIQEQIDLVSAGTVEVTKPATFDWPDFLIPLLMGFLISQLGLYLTERRKEKGDDQKFRSMILAALIASRKAVQVKEPLPVDLWNEYIVKGNLYRALRSSKEFNFPARLAELTIALADYNDRQSTSNLTDEIVGRTEDEITSLIDVLEKGARQTKN